jgi:DNA polymerase-3 subunit delta
MSIKQFHQEFSKGLLSPVYILYSSDDFLLYEALLSIKDEHHSDAFNFDVFDIKSPDDTKPIEQIIDTLNTLPFLSGKRVVVIENIQKLPKKDAKKIEEYMANPSPSSLLVMLYEGKYPEVFDKSALKTAKVIALRVESKDIQQWIKDRARRKGIEFTDRAVEYLMSFVGADLGMLYAEIEKFSSLQLSGSIATVIDENDIKKTVYAGAEYNAFDLINAIRKRDPKEVFRIFENVNRNVEPQMLLGALNWQFTNLWSKSHSREKSSFYDIFKLLHEADAAVKTSHNYVVEDLLIKLLAHG